MMSDHTLPSGDSGETPDVPLPPSAGQRCWRSTELFGDQREVLILHGEEVYRLRRTRNEKLILQK